MSALNQQNQNIYTGTLQKDKNIIPGSQTNVNNIDPTPGILCFVGFLIVLFIIFKKIEQHYLNYFEHKKEMDKLELDLKYGKGKII